MVLSKEVKIGYCLERVEQSIVIMDTTSRAVEDVWHVGRYDKRDPDHMKGDSPDETKCSDCQENHPMFSRSCDIYKGKKELWNHNNA